MQSGFAALKTTSSRHINKNQTHPGLSYNYSVWGSNKTSFTCIVTYATGSEAGIADDTFQQFRIDYFL